MRSVSLLLLSLALFALLSPSLVTSAPAGIGFLSRGTSSKKTPTEPEPLPVPEARTYENVYEKLRTTYSEANFKAITPFLHERAQKLLKLNPTFKTSTPIGKQIVDTILQEYRSLRKRLADKGVKPESIMAHGKQLNFAFVQGVFCRYFSLELTNKSYRDILLLRGIDDKKTPEDEEILSIIDMFLEALLQNESNNSKIVQKESKGMVHNDENQLNGRESKQNRGSDIEFETEMMLSNISDIMLIIHAAYNHGIQKQINDLSYLHLAAKVLTHIVPKDDEALVQELKDLDVAVSAIADWTLGEKLYSSSKNPN